jgi:hypothetical protein
VDPLSWFLRKIEDHVHSLFLEAGLGEMVEKINIDNGSDHATSVTDSENVNDAESPEADISTASALRRVIQALTSTEFQFKATASEALDSSKAKSSPESPPKPSSPSPPSSLRDSIFHLSEMIKSVVLKSVHGIGMVNLADYNIYLQQALNLAPMECVDEISEPKGSGASEEPEAVKKRLLPILELELWGLRGSDSSKRNSRSGSTVTSDSPPLSVMEEVRGLLGLPSQETQRRALDNGTESEQKGEEANRETTSSSTTNSLERNSRRESRSTVAETHTTESHSAEGFRSAVDNLNKPQRAFLTAVRPAIFCGLQRSEVF